MRLAAFILANSQQIIGEWENFALTIVSDSHDASPLALRDHIKDILAFIAEDMESAQSPAQQRKKSRGEAVTKGTKHSAAETHASIRLAGGFNMDQMVSEYRTLRASVVRLWEAQEAHPAHQDLLDLIRFNEAIDQQMTESIRHYTKKLDHSRNLFLGILSHDLRNPLAAAHMSAMLSLKMGGLNERHAMLVAQVVESTERATAIVDSLLDLTRARLGSGLPVVRELMDMGFVSKVMVDEMRAMHPDRTFTLEISGDMEGEWDKSRIGQVFSNLLGNAVQYSFKDTPIDVTVSGTPEEVILSVHNEGVPITPDAMATIFNSLVRGETEDGELWSVNLGLGLYITEEIIAAHGGTIGVTSTEKSGTIFTARLPRFGKSVARLARPTHILNFAEHSK